MTGLQNLFREALLKIASLQTHFNKSWVGLGDQHMEQVFGNSHGIISSINMPPTANPPSLPPRPGVTPVQTIRHSNGVPISGALTIPAPNTNPSTSRQATREDHPDVKALFQSVSRFLSQEAWLRDQQYHNDPGSQASIFFEKLRAVLANISLHHIPQPDNSAQGRELKKYLLGAAKILNRFLKSEQVEILEHLVSIDNNSQPLRCRKNYNLIERLQRCIQNDHNGNLNTIQKTFEYDYKQLRDGPNSISILMDHLKQFNVLKDYDEMQIYRRQEYRTEDLIQNLEDAWSIVQNLRNASQPQQTTDTAPLGNWSNELTNSDVASIRTRTGQLSSFIHTNLSCPSSYAHTDLDLLGCSSDVKLQFLPRWASSFPLEMKKIKQSAEPSALKNNTRWTTVFDCKRFQECSFRIQPGSGLDAGSQLAESSPFCQIPLVGASLNFEVHYNPDWYRQLQPSDLKCLMPGIRASYISLSSIIEGEVSLSRASTTALMLILARGFRPLFNSSWLSKSWERQDIFIMRHGPHVDKDSNAVEILPFLTLNLRDGRPKDLAQDPVTVGSTETLSLLGLGIVLAELSLYCGNAYRTADTPNNQTSRLRFSELIRADHMGKVQNLESDTSRYCSGYVADAVRYCLSLRWSQSSSPFDDPTVLHDYQRKVVARLEKEFFISLGYDPIDNMPDLEQLLEKTINKARFDELFSPIKHTHANSSERFVRHSQNLHQIEPPGTVYDMDPVQSNNKDKEEAKKWFDKIRLIHKFLDRSVPVFAHNQEDSPVRVAILDTGVDLTHPALQGKIKEDQVFDFVTNQEKSIVDETGHGTHCTHILLKTAPYAEVYVGRVFRKNEADDDTALKVAKAIKHAADTWDVDIISMSFGFKDSSEKVSKAINLAKHRTRNGVPRPVLFYAAASNNNHLDYNPIAYPARDARLVTAVFSLDGHGDKSEFSPKGNQHSLTNLAFLGQGLEAAFSEKLSTGGLRHDYRLMSGTSCSTPLAAGTAALVLELLRRKDIRENIPEKLVPKLITADGMNKIFEWMLKENAQRGAGVYLEIQPWHLLRGMEQGNIQVGDLSYRLKDGAL